MKNIRINFLILAAVSVFFTTIFSICVVDTYAATGTTCITSKCHPKMGKDKFVHGPVAAGECDTCHEPTAKHRFKPIKQIADLCYQCHDQKNTMKNVHPPVQEGMCTECHNPHQSAYKFQLLNKPPTLCFNCHDGSMLKKKYVHGPVAVGGCAICHNPHQSNFPSMLMASDNGVCFTCHTDKADAFKQKKFTHEPVKEKCVNCHNPHAGDYEFNFTAEGSSELCFGCHDDKKDWVAKVRVKHGGLKTKERCLACHDPHVSDYVKQLKNQPVVLCISCHDKPLDTPDGKILDMKSYLAENKDHHGPIKQNDCSGCHNTHGSDNFRMLRKYFPPVFYSPFEPKNYALCFNCHEKTLVLDPKTKTLTGFRNGDQNLHFVHVNKKVKGRTCRACHDAHATKNPKHIRDAVPFGTWALPIQHTISKTGGKCSPGCHQTFSYDRTKPVRNR
jgi:predicted CXXCH cytochrome family protein